MVNLCSSSLAETPYKKGPSIRRRLIGDYLPSGRQGADNCIVSAFAAMGGMSGRLRFGPVLIGHFSPLSANEESPEVSDTFPVKSRIRAEPVARTLMRDYLRNVDLPLSINATERDGRFCYFNICYFWMRLVKKNYFQRD